MGMILVVILHQLVVGLGKEVTDVFPCLLCLVVDHYIHREHFAL